VFHALDSFDARHGNPSFDNAAFPLHFSHLAAGSRDVVPLLHRPRRTLETATHYGSFYDPDWAKLRPATAVSRLSFFSSRPTLKPNGATPLLLLLSRNPEFGSTLSFSPRRAIFSPDYVLSSPFFRERRSLRVSPPRHARSNDAFSLCSLSLFPVVSASYLSSRPAVPFHQDGLRPTPASLVGAQDLLFDETPTPIFPIMAIPFLYPRLPL